MMKKLFLSTALILLISSCGFHLRGLANTPEWLKAVALINSSGNKEFESRLRVVLDSYNIAVKEDLKQADYWLIIQAAGYQQHIISVGTGSNPRQYQLIYTVDYRLEKAHAKQQMKNKRIMVTRQLTINNDRILGSNQEMSLLIAEMRQEAAIKLINQLSY